jgi:Mg-chelatase subunit ChlD
VAIAVRGSQASADRGRSPAGRVPETDRVRVTHTIRRALARIAEHHAVLNEHLRATIKTGASCAYLPDPRLSRRSSATQIVTM